MVVFTMKKNKIKNKKETTIKEKKEVIVKKEPKTSCSSKKDCFVRQNFWKITSIVLLILVIVAGILLLTGNKNKVGVDETLNCSINVGQETQTFLTDNFNLPNIGLVSSVTSNDLCLHTFEVQGQELEIYTSLNGELVFIPGLEPIDKSKINLDGSENGNQAPQEIPKTEKPVVELFVMSHCPYGTQAEKGILPAVDVLQDSIDFQIKFVNYAMHDMLEIEEQLLQYCIQEEFNDKYNEYLYCFLEDGDTQRCLDKLEITRDSLDTCITETDIEYDIMSSYENKDSWVNGRFPKFLVHNEDNLKYGVQGSPTLVINGTVVNSNRDPQSLLNTICSGFETLPRACNEVLSSQAPTPGFGFTETTGTTNTATCG
jgi:glutaredoxin